MSHIEFQTTADAVYELEPQARRIRKTGGKTSTGGRIVRTWSTYARILGPVLGQPVIVQWPDGHYTATRAVWCIVSPPD